MIVKRNTYLYLGVIPCKENEKRFGNFFLRLWKKGPVGTGGKVQVRYFKNLGEVKLFLHRNPILRSPVEIINDRK